MVKVTTVDGVGINGCIEINIENIFLFLSTLSNDMSLTVLMLLHDSSGMVGLKKLRDNRHRSA